MRKLGFFLLAALGAVAVWADSAGRVDLFWHVLSGGGAPAAACCRLQPQTAKPLWIVWPAGFHPLSIFSCFH